MNLRCCCCLAGAFGISDNMDAHRRELEGCKTKLLCKISSQCLWVDGFLARESEQVEFGIAKHSLDVSLLHLPQQLSSKAKSAAAIKQKSARTLMHFGDSRATFRQTDTESVSVAHCPLWGTNYQKSPFCHHPTSPRPCSPACHSDVNGRIG